MLVNGEGYSDQQMRRVFCRFQRAVLCVASLLYASHILFVRQKWGKIVRLMMVWVSIHSYYP